MSDIQWNQTDLNAAPATAARLIGDNTFKTGDDFNALVKNLKNNNVLNDPKSAKATQFNKDNWEEALQTRANYGDEAALDYLLNYWMTEKSAETAREFESKRYQTLVNDLKKAGINPYWSTDGAFGAPSFSNTGSSYSGSNYMSARKSRATENNNTLKNSVGNFIPILGTIISALGMMLAFG